MPRIVIDPGHGGHHVRGRSTPYGARAGSIWEKDLNLRLAQRVAAHLGREAVLTRSGDHNLPLGDRAGLARVSGARAFLSLHGHTNYGGTEVYVHPRAAQVSHGLARSVQRLLGAAYGGDYSPSVGELAVLHPEALGPDTAACLVECGYGADERVLWEAQAMDRMGYSIASGVRSFLDETSAARYASAQAATALGQRARITTYPSDPNIRIDAASSWMSEHFLVVSTPGEISISGQVTANGPVNDRFVIQVDQRGTSGVQFYETFELQAGTPLLFARNVVLPGAGGYRIVFYLAGECPPSLSVAGSFNL